MSLPRLPSSPAGPLGSLFAVVALLCTVAWWGARTDATPDAIQQTQDFPSGPLPRAWVHWDSEWYARIAQEGYSYQPGQQSPVAFFPLYPLVIRGLQAFGINRYWGGIGVSFACGVATVLLFSLWARKVSGKEILSQQAASFYLVYPFSFYFFGVMYSDALFAFLVVSAFLLLERQKLAWAVMLGALATAARPVAPAVLIGLMARQWEIRRSQNLPVRAFDLLPMLTVGGLLAYASYLGWKFGDPLAFANVQAAPGWDHLMGWRSWLKVSLWERLLFRTEELGTWLRVFHGVLALGALSLAYRTGRDFGWGYGLYVLVVVGIPALSSKDFHGLGRYALAAFPVFLTLARLLEGRPRLRVAVWLVSAALLLELAYRFAGGLYVA